MSHAYIEKNSRPSVAQGSSDSQPLHIPYVQQDADNLEERDMNKTPTTFIFDTDDVISQTKRDPTSET